MNKILIDIVIGKKFPLANHPLYINRWNVYSTKYNKFIEKFEIGFDGINDLDELIESYGDVERLGYLEVYMRTLERKTW